MVISGLAFLETRGRLEVRILVDLTVMNASAIRNTVLSAWEDRGRPPVLVLDLAGARHIDSSGVGALMEIAHRIEGAGVRLVLSGLNPTAQRMLDRTGLAMLFTIHDPAKPGARDLVYG